MWIVGVEYSAAPTIENKIVECESDAVCEDCELCVLNTVQR